ncbi:type IV pilin [Methanocorpusculum labreanum]|nr:type IV pilin N-terminal domain-containing protein [Methanocorpusculum labreanum]
MKVSTKKNDGVSPVIGTILLVAITVVLVAIISAVVMGMTGDIGSSYVVGVKVTQNATSDGYALLTITGGQNTGDLKALYVYNGTSSTPITATNLALNATPVVGIPYNYYVGTGQVALSVVGNFADGTNQTIYTATVNY